MSKEEYIRIITQVVESPRSDIQKIHRLEEAFNMYVRDTIHPQGIDKDRLIEEFKKELAWIESYCVRDEDRYIEGAMGGLAKAIELVNQQPTSDGWIPVSERLPKEEDLSDDGFVLVQEGQGALFKGRYDTDMSTWYDDVGLDFCNGVIAWQPLPQPYKESENNG